MTQEIARPNSWFRIPDWWMVILTFLLFVVGAVTLKVFYRQFGEMQKQTELLNTQAQQAAKDSVEASKNVQEQLRISRNQVKAAQDSVTAINKQMVAAERPWFGVLNLECNKPEGIIVPPSKCWLNLINTGKSPALAATFQFYSGIFKTLPKKPPYPKFAYALDKLVFLPGTTLRTEAISTPQLQGTDEQELMARRKTFYLYGILHYKDPLTKQTHTTKYCAFWMPLASTGLGNSANSIGSFAVCPVYNEAD